MNQFKGMITKFCSFFIIVFASIALFSCSEKEVDYEVSPDMLISVRTNFLEVEIKGDVANKDKLKKEIEDKLKSKICFFDGDAYEMKLGEEHIIDLYESLKDYHAGNLKISGTYLFDPNELFVTFTFEDEIKTYGIEGYFGNGFYNHFMRQEGGGKHHVVAARQVFSLCADYTEEFKADYPDLDFSAVIKTDMITARALETVKIK